MTNEEVWLKCFASALSCIVHQYSDASYSAKRAGDIADLALIEFKSRRNSKFFEESEKGYR